MKKVLLIAGIVIIVLAVMSLAYGGLNMFGYYNVLDGSSSLYERLHNRMIVFFIIGAVLAIIGAACLIIRSRIKN